MYRDIEKRRAVTRERVKRFRMRKKGITAVTPTDNVTPTVTPLVKSVTPKNGKPVTPSVTPLEHWRDGIIMVNKMPVAKCKPGCPACRQKILDQFEKDNEFGIQEEAR